jgi:hypothetical protein
LCFKTKIRFVIVRTLVDKAMELKEVGGTFGGARKPTKFICLVLKMLQVTGVEQSKIIFHFDIFIVIIVCAIL